MTTVLLNIHDAGFFVLDAMIVVMGIFFGGSAQVIAGYEGIVCGLSAMYATMAQALNEVYGK